MNYKKVLKLSIGYKKQNMVLYIKHNPIASSRRDGIMS